MEETHPYLRKTPWDADVFGVDTFEVTSYSAESLQQIAHLPGHFTIKVDPLADKGLLHAHGFYYCDTLMEPYGTRERFVPYERKEITLTSDFPLADAVALSRGAFVYGRFHRDFHLDSLLADQRYAQWLKQLYEQGNVWGLLYNGELAGFFGYEQNKIVLHALGERYRGKGLAKYFWSKAIQRLFDEGHQELVSSVSAANLAVLNLYASLGFSFRRAVDVYHKLQK